MAGWIKLHRTLRDWEWYDDKNATRLLVHLLISVNYEDKPWKGIIIKSGSMVLSWDSLSRGCGLSIQQCRTSMTKLKSSKEVTIKSTNKYQVVTLVKWDKMQVEDTTLNKQPNNQVTNKQQSNNKQVTTTKEVNNIITKEYKNIINRESEFKNSLQPFLEDFGKDMLNDFYLYWTEKKPKGKKMLFEMQKTFDIKRRLERWSKNNFNKANGNKETIKINRQTKDVIESNAVTWRSNKN